MRTTLDLDPSVLRALRRRKHQEHKTLGQLASELLARALADEAATVPDFEWATAELRPRVDLEDKDAVWKVLDSR